MSSVRVTKTKEEEKTMLVSSSSPTAIEGQDRLLDSDANTYRTPNGYQLEFSYDSLTEEGTVEEAAEVHQLPATEKENIFNQHVYEFGVGFRCGI